MSIPNVTLTIKDGALGQLPANTDNLIAHVGPSSAGSVDTPTLIADLAALKSTFGAGPLVEAVAHQLSVAGGPVLCVRGTTVSAGAAGSVTQPASGTSPVVSVSGAANDGYLGFVKIVKAGALGAATFRYALDSMQTQSIEIVVPSGGSYVLPDTGLTLTFASGTYVANDTYSFTCTPPRMDGPGVTSALTALLADTNDWSVVHVTAMPADAAAAKSIFDAVELALATGATSYRYTCAILDTAPIDSATVTVANTKSAFASAASVRVGVVVGSALLTSPISGMKMIRPAGWPVAARLAQAPVEEDLGRVASGPLVGVARIDLSASDMADLDAARFTTLRSHVGRPGFYITNGKMMASEGSDYQLIQFRRVMDKACKVARSGAQLFLNESLRLNQNGTIVEQEALRIESFIAGRLEAAVVTPGNASAVSVAVSRTENVASTQQLPITIRVRAKGYAKTITVDIGFENPALAPAAA